MQPLWLKFIVLALIQFVALLTAWDVRDANARVTATTGLPKATDGSARSVSISAASHASDGRGKCVMHVLIEARTQMCNRLRRNLSSLIWETWTDDG